MNADINIKKANFQFAMDSEEMAFDLYASWSSFYESAFVRIAEKVLERFNPPDQLISIGTMELDLGLIPRSEFYNRFPLLLEEKLEELMQKLMLAGTPEEIKTVSKTLSLFEAVTHYLIHGYYPWSVGLVQKDFSELFIEMLGEFTKDMTEFLKAYGHYSSLRKRLVLQLEDADLQKLVSAVAPAEGTFIIAYFNLLINERTREKITAATVKDHRDASWEVILAYLLVQKSGHFNRREFIDQTIRQLAAHYGLEYTNLLHFLTGAIAAMTATTNFHSEFEVILTELEENAVSNASPNDATFSKEISEVEAIIADEDFSKDYSIPKFIAQLKNESFRKQLIEKFSYEEFRKLAEIADQSLTEEIQKKIAGYYFALLLEAASKKNIEQQLRILKWDETSTEKVQPVYYDELRKLLKQPWSRRELIRKLNEKQLQGLVKWLVPGEERFVISYAEMLDRQNERNAFEGRTSGEFKLMKWEFIFAVLIENTDSSFNRKLFVFSVVSMLAAHYNLTAYDLLRLVYQTFIDKVVEVDEALVSIISELYFEEKEKKGTRHEINLFDKNLKEEFYSGLILEFIKTGTITDENFTSKLYDILDYLESYRIDLLEQLTEELKKGFLLTDLKQIPQHKKFYRKLILFVVKHYQLNLPGGRKVKSLFENIAEDRFKAVPVTAYKTMLLALLKNDATLYGKAWEAITSAQETVGVTLDQLNWNEEFYFSVLLKFIQTGKFPGKILATDLSSIFNHFESHQPELLKRLIEELKKGFEVKDEGTIQEYGTFYRRLILFAIKQIQPNLTDIAKLQSLFSSAEESRFSEVSVATYKTLLQAVLKNDVTLYEKAWKLLAASMSSATNLQDNPFTTLSDDLVLSLLYKSQSEATKVYLTSNSRAIAERIFSSRKLLEKLAEAYPINNQVATLFPSYLQQLSPEYIYRKLIKYYPAKATKLKILFRWFGQMGISFSETKIASLLAQLLVLLTSNVPDFLEKSLELLLALDLPEITSEQLQKIITKDIKAISDQSVQKRIKSKAAISEEITVTPVDNFVEWLTFHLGTKDLSSYGEALNTGALFHPLAYTQFNRLLTTQPELILNQIETGILSKHKINSWIKAAPKATQLKWMQVISSPWHRNVLSDAFRLLQWIKESIAGIMGVTFNEQKVMELLLEFSSGKLQNTSEKNLYNLIINAAIENATDEQWLQLVSSIKSKAVNGGKPWVQKLGAISSLDPGFYPD